MGKNTQQKTGGILREFSSGGAVFKEENGVVLWLVCKSNPSKEYPGDYWRLPKGWIDDRDNGINPGPVSSGERKATESELRVTAIREVEEEGGVMAAILKKIGTNTYFMNSSRGHVMKFVTFYLMEFIEDLPGGFGFETEKIVWLPINEAIDLLNSKTEKETLVLANELLKTVI